MACDGNGFKIAKMRVQVIIAKLHFIVFMEFPRGDFADYYFEVWVSMS